MPSHWSDGIHPNFESKVFLPPTELPTLPKSVASAKTIFVRSERTSNLAATSLTRIAATSTSHWSTGHLLIASGMVRIQLVTELESNAAISPIGTKSSV